MKQEEDRKINAFQRFGILVVPSAFASFISFIQLGYPLGEGAWRPVFWATGFIFAAVSLWQLYIVSKGSN